MRILYLSPRQCWPAVSGAKLRDYHLARLLGGNAELTYLYFKGNAAIADKDLPFCHKLVAVNKPRPYTPAKILRGLFARLPLTLINYSSPEMTAAVTELTRASAFDLVHVDSLHMVSYLPALPDALRQRVVVSWHNIESELLLRYAATTRSLPRKIYASLTVRRVASVEREILRTCFGHLVCSERERQALLARVPEARIAVVGNGVDTKAFDGAFDGMVKTTRNRVLFVGSMAYHANSDAILWFTGRIWPAIHERFPHWTLTVVGSDPPPQVRALAGRPGVEVTGTVPDVKPYYTEAAMAIVPLLTGGGTRLKILEALAAGVPVVSTTLGIEGLAVTHGEEVLIADKEADWLPACCSLADQGALWQKLVTTGRRLVETRYDWDVLGKSMVTTYRQWLSDAAS